MAKPKKIYQIRKAGTRRGKRLAAKGKFVVIKTKPSKKEKPPVAQPRFKPSPMGEVSIG